MRIGSTLVLSNAFAKKGDCRLVLLFRFVKKALLVLFFCYEKKSYIFIAMVAQSDFLFSAPSDVQVAQSAPIAAKRSEWKAFHTPGNVADVPRKTRMLPHAPVAHYQKKFLGKWCSALDDIYKPYCAVGTSPGRHYDSIMRLYTFAAGHVDVRKRGFGSAIFYIRLTMPYYFGIGAFLGVLQWYVRMKRNGWIIKNPNQTEGISFDDGIIRD